MAEQDVMALDSRLARLEQTVARGFFAHEARFERLEDRATALETKLDVVAESIRGDIQTVLEGLTAFSDEMRRTTEAIRREHAADRRLTRSVLRDHSVRLRTLERQCQAR